MIIRNGYFNGLAGLWSFHTILEFTGGSWIDCRTFLQNELKFAILTIGNLRDNRISEYTGSGFPPTLSGFPLALYEGKWFFPELKEEFIRGGQSSFYERTGKNRIVKIEQ